MIKKNLLFFLCLIATTSFAFENEAVLEKADSLFASRNFKQAAVLYDSLHFSLALSTPQMLIKMAFLAEENKDTAKALYLLSSAYLLKPEKGLKNKIDYIASLSGLSSYEELPSATEQWLFRNYNWMGVALLILAGLLLIWTLLNENKLFPKIILSLLGLSMMVAGYLLSYRAPKWEKALPKNQTTLLLKEPSAGGLSLSYSGKSELLPLIKNQAPYIKLRWKDSVYFAHPKQFYSLSIE